MKMHAARYSEISRRFYQTSRRHTLEGLSAEAMQVEKASCLVRLF